MDLNGIIDQWTYQTYTTFHPTRAKYIFFSRVPGSFSRKDHMLGYYPKKSADSMPSPIKIPMAFFTRTEKKKKN